MNRRIPHFIISSALATLLAATAHAAGTATFADCVRDDGLDVWAAQDSAFCRNVMAEVFKGAGIDAERLPAVRAAGARNWAVVRAVCRSADPYAAILKIARMPPPGEVGE